MTAVFYRDPNHTYPLATRAEGMYLFDEKGKSYLDMCGGAAVSCLGHQHPDVVEAVKEQASKMAFAHTAFFSNEPQEQLADTLCQLFGEDGARAYFTAGGSEANETALKFAWQYWSALGQPSKTKIISRQHSYHGNTLGALSVSGNPGRRAPVAPVLHDWPRVDACYAYRGKRDDESDHAYGQRMAQQLEDTILREGADTIAAFIAEPVSGASLGAVTAPEGYFQKIREICDRHDVLLIADEIMCGTGRTGSFFAHEQEGFLPDIVTLAKGLGGGYQPIAATIVRAKLADAFMSGAKGFSHGHTYIGHAMTCAASNAVLDVIQKNQLLGAVVRQGEKLDKALREAFASHPNVGDIRGRGLFRAIELVNGADRKPPQNGGALAARIKDTAMKHGLMCYPSGGTVNTHILLAPPYILEDSHIEEAVTRLRLVMEEVFDA